MFTQGRFWSAFLFFVAGVCCVASSGRLVSSVYLKFIVLFRLPCLALGRFSATLKFPCCVTGNIPGIGFREGQFGPTCRTWVWGLFLIGGECTRLVSISSFHRLPYCHPFFHRPPCRHPSAAPISSSSSFRIYGDSVPFPPSIDLFFPSFPGPRSAVFPSLRPFLFLLFPCFLPAPSTYFLVSVVSP